MNRRDDLKRKRVRMKTKLDFTALIFSQKGESRIESIIHIILVVIVLLVIYYYY